MHLRVKLTSAIHLALVSYVVSLLVGIGNYLSHELHVHLLYRLASPHYTLDLALNSYTNFVK